MHLSRNYAKLCDRRDFDDPEVRAAIREIVPGKAPDDELHRKYWEYALLALFLRDVGALHDEASILSVGAGHEEPLYWLANRVGRVVATDVYGKGPFDQREADASMLHDPRAFAPYPYREDRLEAHWMDARALAFEDGTFDAVFSLSSIEHFGCPRDIARASSEIGRVLRPGGHALIVTECFLSFHLLDSATVQTVIRALTFGRHCHNAAPRRRVTEVFSPRELLSRVVRPSGLNLMQSVDLTVSPETFENVAQFVDDELRTETGRPYPHIVLRSRGAPWTSVALPLEKRAA